MHSMEAGKMKRTKLTIILFIFICLAAAISVITRKSGYSFAGLQDLMSLIMIIVVVWYGWLLVRKYNSSLIQNILFGCVLSFGSHWSLLFFHEGWEILQLFVINTAIFAFVSLLGGCLAFVFNKFIGAKKRK